MSGQRSRARAQWGSGLLIAAVALVFAGSCARNGDAQPSATQQGFAADDTTGLARVLAAVRGVDPILCELVTRHVDMRGWWSRWGSMDGSPLEVDSGAAVLVAWVQRQHTNPVVVPRLRAALRDADRCVRRVAGSFLGRVSHPTAVAALLEGAEDGSAETRHAATLGLGLRNDVTRSETGALVRRLKDENANVRRAAAWGLGAHEHAPARDDLIALLERDPDPRVRQAAAWALGRIAG